MKRVSSKKQALQLLLLLTSVVATSVWVGSLLLAPNRPKPSVLITTTSINPSPTGSKAPQIWLQVYWLRSDQNQLTLVAKSLPSNVSTSSSSERILITTMQQLLVAQPSDNLTNTIPVGTKLRSLQIKADGVHVDLSKEFRAGGGSTSMIYRLAQVIYTASSLDPDAKIFVLIEGQPIDENHPLGGEGLILSQPVTRSQFAVDFSISE